jgi:hypothetical protein
MSAAPVQPLAGRRRPLWLVATLSILTLGLYVPIWFGLTWSEMRKEKSDDQMFPLGHALSILVPGWNAWQTWRHFTVIDALGSSVTRARVDALSGTIGLVIWWLTFTHYSTEPLFVALDGIELLAGTAVVVYGQRALNGYWASKGGEERLLETDIFALAAAMTYAIFTLIGMLTASS